MCAFLSIAARLAQGIHGPTVAPAPLTSESFVDPNARHYFFTPDQVEIDTYRQAMESVVALDMVVPRYDNQLLRMSGFIATEQGHVVTCAHCVVDRWLGIPFPLERGKIEYRGEEISLAGSTLVYANYDLGEPDIAVLHVPSLTGRGMLHSRKEIPSNGEMGALIGYPRMMSGPKVLSIGTVLEVKQFMILTGNSSYQETIETDAESQLGNSGGPFVDRQGHVMGIVSLGPAGSFNSDQTRLSSMVSSRIIQNVLKRLSL